MNSPKVLIIVVTWNKKTFVINLLKQLKEKVKYKNYDLLLIDNASSDGTDEIIKNNFPEIIYIRNKVNLGGTGGFNTGLAYAMKNSNKYNYIWLLDNDAELIGDPLSPVINLFEVENNIGVIGSTILSKENKSIITEIGGLIVNKNRILGNCKGKKLNDCKKDYYDVDYVASCSAFLKMEALLDVGLWDNYYFIYFDDVDFFWSIKRKGYKVIATKLSQVSHPDFIEKSNIFGGYYYMRNSFYFFLEKYKLKGVEVFNFLKYKVFYLVFDFIRGDKRNFIVMKKAIKDYFSGLKGKSLWIEKYLKKEIPIKHNGTKINIKDLENIVFSFSTKFGEFENLYRKIKNENPNIKVFFLSDVGRIGLIKTISNDIKVIEVKFNKKWETILKFIKLIFKEKAKYVYSFKGAFGNFIFKYRIFEKDGKFFIEKNKRFVKWLRLIFLFPPLYLYYIMKFNLQYIIDSYKKNRTTK